MNCRRCGRRMDQDWIHTSGYEVLIGWICLSCKHQETRRGFTEIKPDPSALTPAEREDLARGYREAINGPRQAE